MDKGEKVEGKEEEGVSSVPLVEKVVLPESNVVKSEVVEETETKKKKKKKRKKESESEVQYLHIRHCISDI